MKISYKNNLNYDIRLECDPICLNSNELPLWEQYLPGRNSIRLTQLLIYQNTGSYS